MTVLNSEQAGVVEYVTFKSKSEVSSEELRRELQATDAVLDGIDGFVKRYLAQQESGLWVEVVFWRDQVAAEAGLKVFLGDSRSQALLALIEDDSVNITYSNIF